MQRLSRCCTVAVVLLAAAFGVRAELGSVVEPPPGPVIRNLMELWSRQIGR